MRQLSIYQEVLKQEFIRLHPMLQKRYALSDGATYTASGIMNEINGGPKWLFPLFRLGVHWKLLFPEHGKNISFTLKNAAYTDSNGVQRVHWERIFHFEKNKRYFNALMSLDKKRMIIEDFLGEPSLFYSDLRFTVSEEGHLTIESLDQRLLIGKFEIPVPRLFQGLATVVEKYDEDNAVYRIHVVVRNPLIGIVFSYEGVFSTDA